MNLTQKIIGSHLVSGTMTPGSEIGLRIDQTLTQDATGTMAWLQFEALGIPRVKTDISLSYVDHNTLQMNFRNPDDHRFLRTVAAKFGGVYSGPGTGICHQLHLENFAKPGATLVGSDSHTPTAGGICSLAMGAGGLSVALAMAGEPYYIPMPKVVRVFLTGALTGWASAKDVILELLRRRTVKGGVLVDLAHIKSLPKHKICIITTGSQGETMSALTRMAFNTHRQVEIQAGDRVILSASAIPGNENAIGSVINELYRKDAEVVNERLGALHVSGHACQEELKIIHALVKPKFFIPVHGEQRHLKTHAKLAQQMGMPPKNILISDIGKVIELTPNSAKINGTVPAGRVFVDGYGVGDVGSVVLRDRKHLAEDGMIVVVVSMSGEDGSVVSGPDIITRGFVYVKESEGLMEELRKVAVKALEECRMDTMNDWASIKSEIKNAISGFLYKKTKRNPMILPVIMEV